MRRLKKFPPVKVECEFRAIDFQTKIKIAARAEGKRVKRFVIEAALARAEQSLQLKLPMK